MRERKRGRGREIGGTREGRSVGLLKERYTKEFKTRNSVDKKIASHFYFVRVNVCNRVMR